MARALVNGRAARSQRRSFDAWRWRRWLSGARRSSALCRCNSLASMDVTHLLLCSLVPVFQARLLERHRHPISHRRRHRFQEEKRLPRSGRCFTMSWMMPLRAPCYPRPVSSPGQNRCKIWSTSFATPWWHTWVALVLRFPGCRWRMLYSARQKFQGERVQFICSSRQISSLCSHRLNFVTE
jgi:hypothetical protein